MKQEKLYPIWNGQFSISRVPAYSTESIFLQGGDMIRNEEAMGKQVLMQLLKLHLAALIKTGILLCHIPLKQWRFFFFDSPKSIHKRRLVSRKVGYVFERTPFPGIGPHPQLFFIQSPRHFDNGFMLMLETGMLTS